MEDRTDARSTALSIMGALVISAILGVATYFVWQAVGLVMTSAVTPVRRRPQGGVTLLGLWLLALGLPLGSVFFLVVAVYTGWIAVRHRSEERDRARADADRWKDMPFPRE